MTASFADLWPDEIAIDVLAPVALLRMQATALNRRMKGILDAEVKSCIVAKSMPVRLADPFGKYDSEKPSRQQHSLILKAPILKHEEVVVAVFHHELWLYPVCFDDNRIAYTQEELIEQLRKVLQSKETLATLNSLIARSNEAKGTYAVFGQE